MKVNNKVMNATKLKNTNSIIKFIAACIISLGISSTAVAKDNDLCEIHQNLAFAIMQSRQSGLSLIEALKIADGEPSTTAIVRMAFAHPKYSSEEYQQEASNAFALKVYSLCREQRKERT